MFTRQVKVQVRKSTVEKYNIKGRSADSGGKKQPFHPSLPSWDAPFPSFDRKWTAPIRQRRTSKCLFPRRRFYLQLYKRYSLNGKG